MAKLDNLINTGFLRINGTTIANDFVIYRMPTLDSNGNVSGVLSNNVTLLPSATTIQNASSSDYQLCTGAQVAAYISSLLEN